MFCNHMRKNKLRKETYKVHHSASLLFFSAADCCQGNWKWSMTLLLCGLIIQSIIFSGPLWKCPPFKRRQVFIQRAAGGCIRRPFHYEFMHDMWPIRVPVWSGTWMLIMTMWMLFYRLPIKWPRCPLSLLCVNLLEKWVHVLTGCLIQCPLPADSRQLFQGQRTHATWYLAIT